MKFPLLLCTALSLTLLSGCEECAFCTGEAVTWHNGVEVSREEIPATRYCDELLQELRANPVDTSYVFDDSLGQVMVITTNDCF